MVLYRNENHIVLKRFTQLTEEQRQELENKNTNIVIDNKLDNYVQHVETAVMLGFHMIIQWRFTIQTDKIYLCPVRRIRQHTCIYDMKSFTNGKCIQLNQNYILPIVIDLYYRIIYYCFHMLFYNCSIFQFNIHYSLVTSLK